MKIRNTTNEMRQTWEGHEINAGAPFDATGLPEHEIEWLLRHGFEKVVKAKPKPKPTMTVDTQPPFADVAPDPPPSLGYRRKARSRKG